MHQAKLAGTYAGPLKAPTSGTFALRRRKTIWLCVAVLKKMTNGICALP